MNFLRKAWGKVKGGFLRLTGQPELQSLSLAELVALATLTELSSLDDTQVSSP